MFFHLRFAFLLPYQDIFFTTVRNAGHSKWQNIRHIKLAKDTIRSTIISKAIVAVRRSIRLGGGSFDPKVNDKLRDALDKCRKLQVPSATIERSLKKLKESPPKNFIMEVLGPKNMFMLLDIETLELTPTKSYFKSLVNRHKGYNTIKCHFFEKGVISLSTIDKEEKQIDFDKAEEIAIEAGVEEVSSSNDEEWRLITDTESLFRSKGLIEKKFPNVEILKCDVEYFPHNYMEFEVEDLKLASCLIDSLNEESEIKEIYSNIKSFKNIEQ